MTEKNDPNIRMTLSWEDEESLFLLTYLYEDKIVFQVKMEPQHFEQFTADMVRVVKDYNLKQAIEHQQKLEQENEIGRDRVDDAKEENDGSSGSSDESQDTQQESVQGSETIS